MVPSQINGRDGLEAYLRTLDDRKALLTARHLAFRASARILPVAVRFALPEEGASDAIAIHPTPLFAEVALFGVIAEKIPTPIDRTTANALETAHAAASGFGDAAATLASQVERLGPTASAPQYAASALGASRAVATARSVSDAVGYAAEATEFAAFAAAYAAGGTGAGDSAYGAMQETMQADVDWYAGTPGRRIPPLWHGLKEFVELGDWSFLKTRLEADATDWSFWILWYERVRAGRDVHADKLAEILNPLREEDWKKGPAHVNPLFDDLLALYREEDDRDGRSGEPVEQRKPANLKAIRSQIVALKHYVDGEFEFLRVQNQLSSVDGVARETMLEVLQALREIVDDLLATFDRDGDTSTALIHVDERLPAVLEKAGEIAELETRANISGPIIIMTANVKYLTDNGWPGHLAVGAAAGELGWQYLKSGWRYVAAKDAKEPTAFTRFPFKGDDQ